MKTRNSALYALGLAAAITLGGAMSADAQKKTTTRKRVAPRQSIPVRKDVPVAAKADTVFVTRVDTVTVRRTDTVTTVGPTRYDTVTRMVYPPLRPLPGLFFGLGAGAYQPMNNINAVVKASYAGQAQVGYFPGLSPLGIRGDVNYGIMHDRENDCKKAGQGPCQNVKVLTGGLDAILRMPLDRTSKLNPVLYVFGGGGYSKFSDITTRQTVGVGGGADFRNGSQAYWDVGPGIDFDVAGLHLYAEGKYMTFLTGKADGAINANQKNVHAFPIFGGLKFGW